MTNYGLENIAPQGPAFFKELSQDIKDLITTIPPATPGESLDDRLQQVTFILTDSVASQKIQKTIEKYLGIHVDIVKFDPSPIVTAMFVSPVSFSVPTRTPYATMSQYHRVLTELTSSMDVSTGHTTVGTHNQRKVILWLGSSFFIINEFYKDAAFTPEMIAAIILHELGHWYNLTSAMYRCQRVVSLADTLTYFTPKTITAKDVSSMIEDILSTFKKLRLRKTKNTDLFIHQFNEVKTTLAKTPDISVESLQALSNYISYIASLVFSTDLVERSDADHTTDVFSTGETKTWEERSADTFAARYGAGESLISGLKILYRLREKGMTALDTGLIFSSDQLDRISLKLTPFEVMQTILGVSPTVMSDAYDRDLKRLREILKSLYPVFKTIRGDSPTGAYYLDQVEKCQKQIDTFLSLPEIKYRETFRKGLDILNKYGFAAFHLFTEDLTQQYGKLQLLTRNFVDNPLYYQHARLERLMQRRDPHGTQLTH